jgi:hypothetical protein
MEDIVVARGNKLAQFEKKTTPYGLKPKELIILAMGPSRGQCPFDAEVWSLNMSYEQMAALDGRIDKIFLAHKQVYHPETKKPYFDWDKMGACSTEIINTHKIKGVKAKIFPMKRIIKKFGTDYFSNTVCYMIAYALDKSTREVNGHLELKEGAYTKLRLYGVDMQQKDEYQWEKPGIEFWLGIAKGLGIDYTVSLGSALFDTITGKPYGVKPYVLKDIDPMGLLKRKNVPKKSN